MRVIPVAYTVMNRAAAMLAGYWPQTDPDVQYIDELAEFAGRNCYQAWERKNPATATNQGYLANIIDHGHFSVLEHGSVTFYVDGISRALTHELIRHRHLSFSELSQRFVNVEDAEFITPPALLEMLQQESPGITWEESNKNFREDSAAKAIVKAYQSIFRRLTGYGLKRKQAREAARAVMPNCTETKIVVTGNLRAWREVIAKRHSVHADAEIRAFAGLVLTHLRDLAPHSVQDIPETPYE